MASTRFSYEDLRNKGFQLNNGVFEKAPADKVSKPTPKVNKKIEFEPMPIDKVFGLHTPIIVFHINPIGKPRMTSGDKANYRPKTKVYWEYKSELNRIAAENNYYIGKTLDVEFHMPMPEGWSEKKKASMCGTPHDNTPDLDNLFKALTDCLCKQDKSISDVSMKKRWAYSGMILIY